MAVVRANAGLEGSADAAKRLEAWLAIPKEDTRARIHRVSLTFSLLAIAHESCADAGARWQVRFARAFFNATLVVRGQKSSAVEFAVALSNASLRSARGGRSSGGGMSIATVGRNCGALGAAILETVGGGNNVSQGCFHARNAS